MNALSGRLRLSILLCASVVALATAARADENAQREAVETRTKALLEARNYAGLAQEETEYLRTKARTSAGVWKLTLYYLAVREWLAHRGRSSCSVEARKFVDDWTRATPQSPAAIIAKGAYMTEEAFCIRGLEFADKVNPKAWAPFYSRLELARRYLESHRASADGDPQWFAEMETVATAQGWDKPQFMALIKAAQAREPLYDLIYETAADMYFQPKWNGSLEELDEFARYAVKSTERWEGSGVYARIYWSVQAYATQSPGVPMEATSKIDWTLMKTAMEDLARRYPDPWNVNNFALISCVEGDSRETKYFMEKISGPLQRPPWRDAAQFADCRAVANNPSPGG